MFLGFLAGLASTGLIGAALPRISAGPVVNLLSGAIGGMVGGALFLALTPHLEGMPLVDAAGGVMGGLLALCAVSLMANAAIE